MTVATAFAVSWNPFTNSKPSATSSAVPSRRYGQEEPSSIFPKSREMLVATKISPATSTTPKTSVPMRLGPRFNLNCYGSMKAK